MTTTKRQLGQTISLMRAVTHPREQSMTKSCPMVKAEHDRLPRRALQRA